MLNENVSNSEYEQVKNITKEINKDEQISSFEFEFLTQFNNTFAQYEKNKTINEIFVEQAEKTPENVALVIKDRFMTYRQLNDKSNQLAKILRRNKVGTETIVGIMVNRSFEMIIGIIAVLKAGGSYLPIDPEYPDERIRYMLEDSQAKILLTQKELFSRINFEGEKIDIYDPKNYLIDENESIDVINKPDDLAYLIYTSGSSGKPKGVMINHRAVINLIKGITDVINFSSDKTILCITTISFDIFVLETILPLLNGLKVVIADEDEQKNPKLLANVIEKNNIDMLQITPSRMQLLLNYKNAQDSIKDLKEIMIGGEPFPAILLEKLKKITNGRIYNMYGPTETTVWSTVRDLTQSDRVDIGRPIANTQIYIVNENGHICNIGSEGEICISGDGLARGYFNKPELTKERFIQNPLLTNQRMYKTGDIGRWCKDGNVECLGRLDNQVKIRGFRIELEEIEAQILGFGYIEEVVVAAVEGNDGNKSLCAYYISCEEITENELKKFLLEKLPKYMVPSYFVKIEKFPLTPNGKIDRKLLPVPAMLELNAETNDEEDIFKNIRNNPIDEKLVSIYQEVLGISFPNSARSDLSVLGLDSISNMKTMLAFELEFEIEFEIDDLLPDRFTTIEELADHIKSLKDI